MITIRKIIEIIPPPPPSCPRRCRAWPEQVVDGAQGVATRRRGRGLVEVGVWLRVLARVRASSGPGSG